MALTELSITIWHDLAAPTLVGIATGLFLGWWHRRK
ncbi:small toxic polypeptide LdrA/LdrC [Salmonella enterica]|nr:small toxic polypeptide LdrA/LdrC [Salmonella enterica subsp. enterica serovar Nigeria]EDC4486648.1 small toxic polypeptide LdrA/LdrC [Salmonella enterica]ECB1325398.1 small toxic polypeptide LdrA/LdrC [Salmonella enterica subsp. enterica serovar Nigeria]ECB4004345.1 small toxic polypeptide LdrA/LdrC [Salmonella enterica subsp. enterica serovar Nigeria]ECJ1028381.1 small toxic polypeptide LdrA/LdrC [Salmonella enterica subsp. enterica serovar Nigeria]